MPALLLACLTYLSVALPGSTLGLLWPSMRVSFGQPVGALGLLLVAGVTASVLASAATGRLLARGRLGPLLALGVTVSALALAAEAAAPSLWVFTGGVVLFGLGFGVTDAALNVHAAGHFGARDINWMHASYGLGATIGPLLVTVLRADGISWRWSYGAMAAVLAALACVLGLARRAWLVPAVPPVRAVPPASPGPAATAAPGPGPRSALLPRERGRRKLPSAAILGALTFTAVETGLESGAGIWGYLFLTAGRGLTAGTAGVVVSAYWAMMFAGRVVLGPVAERVGPARLLATAVAGVPLGAALMASPGPPILAVAGLMILGLAAAPVFPLFTLTTAHRASAARTPGSTRTAVRTSATSDTVRTVSLQVAASAVGGAAVPAGLGLAIGAVNVRILGPSLLVLGLVMCCVYRLLSRPARPPV